MKYLSILYVVLWLCLGANGQVKNNRSVTKVDSGMTFHFSEMIDINNKKIRPSDLYGKIVVINFWFIGCAPCMYEIQQLAKIAEDYKNDKNVIFLAISTDSVSAVKNFLKSNAFNYRLAGENKKLISYYGVKTFPLNLIINKQGVIIFNSQKYFIASVPERIRNVLSEKL